MFYTYILYSKSKNKYYIGSTGNIEDRIHRHNAGQSKSTKSGVPWELVYTEEFNTRSEATKRETQIKKKKSRQYIEKIILAD